MSSFIEIYSEMKRKNIEKSIKEFVEEVKKTPQVEFKPVMRPAVTQEVIDGFTKLLDSQDKKGIEKYGSTIDEALIDPETNEPYDWRLMAMEELADFTKYQVKEIKRLEAEVKKLNGYLETQGNNYKKAKEEIELLKAEKAYYMELSDWSRGQLPTVEELNKWQKVAKARLNEMRELQWRNIDLQNEIAALKETDQNQVITQEAFEKVLKERDEAREEIKSLTMQMSIAGTSINHYCHKNQMIIWHDERHKKIDSIECQICGKTLYEAGNE